MYACVCDLPAHVTLLSQHPACHVKLVIASILRVCACMNWKCILWRLKCCANEQPPFQCMMLYIHHRFLDASCKILHIDGSQLVRQYRYKCTCTCIYMSTWFVCTNVCATSMLEAHTCTVHVHYVCHIWTHMYVAEIASTHICKCGQNYFSSAGERGPEWCMFSTQTTEPCELPSHPLRIECVYLKYARLLLHVTYITMCKVWIRTIHGYQCVNCRLTLQNLQLVRIWTLLQCT